MNREEARLNLDACTLRPGDAAAEARALAQSDAALGAWVGKRSAFDEKIFDTFHAAPVPAGLNDRLLAAMMAEAAAPASAPAFRVASLMPWLALAAVVALSGVGLFWKAKPAAWELEALALVQQVDTGKMPLDEFSNDLTAMKSLLADAKAPAPENLPKDFSEMESLGCKVIQIAGRPASLVCFEITPGKEAHLVTFMAKDMPGAPSQAQPLFAERDGWHTATWRVGDQGYFLATQADVQALKGLFAHMQTNGHVRRLV